MSKPYNLLLGLLLGFLLLAALSGLVLTNERYVSDHPGETNFLVPWLAARTFLTYGDNPYSIPAAQRAQVIHYGRLAAEGEDPLILGIPFLVELFYFPFALIPDYNFARAAWMTVLQAALIYLAVISLNLVGWKPARTLFPVLLVFSVLWIYGYLPLAESRGTILVALAIAGAFIAMRAQLDELAGALLIFPLFKPDMAGLLVLYVVGWAIINRRGRILAGMLMSLVLLTAISFFILWDWFSPFINGQVSTFKYNPGITPGGIFSTWWPVVGPRLGWALTGVMLVIFIAEWQAAKHKDFRHFLWTASLTLAGTPLLGIPIHPQDYVLLFLPLVLLLAIMAERWSKPGKWGLPGLTLVIIFLLPWVMESLFSLNGDPGSFLKIFSLVFPFVLVIGLYWIRWWAVRPPRTWKDGLP